jgi:hypothetical protein
MGSTLAAQHTMWLGRRISLMTRVEWAKVQVQIESESELWKIVWAFQEPSKMKVVLD